MFQHLEDVSPSVGNVVVDPVHGGAEHLVLRVHSEVLRGDQLRQKVFVDLLELFLLADEVEVVMDVVESNPGESLNVVPVCKPVYPCTVRTSVSFIAPTINCYFPIALDSCSSNFRNSVHFSTTSFSSIMSALIRTSWTFSWFRLISPL